MEIALALKPRYHTPSVKGMRYRVSNLGKKRIEWRATSSSSSSLAGMLCNMLCHGYPVSDHPRICYVHFIIMSLALSYGLCGYLYLWGLITHHLIRPQWNKYLYSLQAVDDVCIKGSHMRRFYGTRVPTWKISLGSSSSIRPPIFLAWRDSKRRRIIDVGVNVRITNKTVQIHSDLVTEETNHSSIVS